jgi:hypothetical protein
LILQIKIDSFSLFGNLALDLLTRFSQSQSNVVPRPFFVWFALLHLNLIRSQTKQLMLWKPSGRFSLMLIPGLCCGLGRSAFGAGNIVAL